MPDARPLQLVRLLAGVYIRVAGFTIHVSSADPGLRLAPNSAAAPFVVEPAAADVEIAVTAGPLDEAGDRVCLFDSGGPWRLYRHEQGFLYAFGSPALESSSYKTALFDPEFSSGRIALHVPFFGDAPTIDPLEYPLDELLVIARLGQGRGVEIHGCAVVDGSAGYLFVGQSGAGKSTMARLWLEDPECVILSDDRVVLRAESDGLWMYGTPWHGEEPLASPRRARLRGIYLLRQHQEHTLAELPRPAAVARLFAASFPSFHNAPALDFTLSFLDRVATEIPCFELGFTPVSSVREFVRTAQPSGGRTPR